MTGLPAGWVEAQVGDLVEVLDSMRVPVNRKERDSRPGDVPYYGASGHVGWIDRPLFDEELCLLGEDGAPFLDPGRQKAYVIKGPSWVNNHAHVLRVRPAACLAVFLKYALDVVDYRPYVTGTTRLKLTQAAMVQIPIALPPLAEQQRIVAAIEEQLSRLDSSLNSLARGHRRLAMLRAAVLNAAMNGHPVGELGSALLDLRYGTFAKCSYSGAGAPVLRIPNVRDGRIEIDDLKRAIDVDLDVGSLKLESGDLLFVRTNGSRNLIGRVAAADQRSAGMAFASYLIRARVDRSKLNPDFAVIALSSPRLRALIEARAATTAGQYNLGRSAINSLPIVLPSTETQAKIIAKVQQELSVIDAVASEISKATSRATVLRQSILREAFAGCLVPQDAADEPASALLERIRAERACAPRRRLRSSSV